MIRRLLSATAAAAVATGGLLVATEAPADAASCTSPKVIYHTALTYAGKSYGYVDLEYSTACHSARAHIHSIYKSIPGDSHGAYATITRVGGSPSKQCTLGYKAQDCTTAWLPDLDPNKAKAHGDIDLYASDSTSGGYHDAVGTTPAY